MAIISPPPLCSDSAMKLLCALLQRVVIYGTLHIVCRFIQFRGHWAILSVFMIDIRPLCLRLRSCDLKQTHTTEIEANGVKLKHSRRNVGPAKHRHSDVQLKTFQLVRMCPCWYVRMLDTTHVKMCVCADVDMWLCGNSNMTTSAHVANLGCLNVGCSTCCYLHMSRCVLSKILVFQLVDIVFLR